MKRTKTSKSWMAEHVNDPFVQRAKSEGWRARAAYKLMEIDDKDKLIRPGMIVVDLGAAPGSWSQVAKKRVGELGRVFALDLLPMEPIPGVEFMQGDKTLLHVGADPHLRRRTEQHPDPPLPHRLEQRCLLGIGIGVMHERNLLLRHAGLDQPRPQIVVHAEGVALLG